VGARAADQQVVAVARGKLVVPVAANLHRGEVILLDRIVARARVDGDEAAVQAAAEFDMIVSAARPDADVMDGSEGDRGVEDGCADTDADFFACGFLDADLLAGGSSADAKNAADGIEAVG